MIQAWWYSSLDCLVLCLDPRNPILAGSMYARKPVTHRYKHDYQVHAGQRDDKPHFSLLPNLCAIASIPHLRATALRTATPRHRIYS